VAKASEHNAILLYSFLALLVLILCHWLHFESFRGYLPGESVMQTWAPPEILRNQQPLWTSTSVWNKEHCFMHEHFLKNYMESFL
jgi:hypothetical protein